PRKPKIKERPVFLSEFGGYSYLAEGHVYTNKSYGYGTCKTPEELTARLMARYEELVLPYIKEGLCGSIYTQISDVEDEINGLYTYDRKICKVDRNSMLKLAERIQQEIETDNA
ncbi:MAG: glycoside hydrolase family 2, partial [Lachnospiraceae bacterium]|nr:glycoside hydrolase family 2 [Lachnospiraceae bacterium]